MEHFSEKRSARRYIHKLPMNLYRMDYQDVHLSYYAEMSDYCDNGLSLMTNEKLVLGELIRLELKNYEPNTQQPKIGKNHNGIIRWGKRYPSANAGANGLYKYGVEFSA
ncbi:PilZ domain-containing protein [uncultured Desulfobacter sp.]|uniref:PilZ domain-containing protein n=1 Tax=uncultured Desulfobacter sp. TaxID=240139 RepID=UPI0029F50D0C|nr:PilZ domain-containing protein [uncultured Desulfobacter sp.]